MTPLRLQIVTEAQALREAGSPDRPVPEPWTRTVVSPHRRLPDDDHRAWVSGRAFGPAREDWTGDRDPLEEAEVSLCRTGPVWHFPRWGSLFDGDGRGLFSTFEGVEARTPDFAALPGMGMGPDGPLFAPPADAPELGRASVFMAWGGTFNYGHFLLDCLPALLAIEESGLLSTHPAVAPALEPWHADLLAMAFGEDFALAEVPAPVARLDEAVFSTAMSHLLHKPTPLVARLRDRILARGPAPQKQVRRVYLSRRAQSMRVMVNEAELEKALRKRGFTIVRPETLSARQQVALLRDAEVVVAATGAALANALFMAPGAKVIEIQPENFTSQWVAAMCRLTGAEWSGYVCHSPAPDSDAPLIARMRRGFRFAYRLPLEDFLGFVDAHL